MVLYDMLRNATRASLEDIVRRQKLLRYDYDVLRPAGPGNWKAPCMEDRIAFVRAFYNYARTNPNGRPQIWSEWLRSGGQGVRCAQRHIFCLRCERSLKALFEKGTTRRRLEIMFQLSSAFKV